MTAHWSRVTDKVEPHGYYPAYLKLAADIGPEGRVCEIGVAGGGSLEMWRALFPFGLVAGVDRDPGMTWPPGTERIVMDAADPALPARLAQLAPAWDLIVDDGCHHGDVARRTWELLWPLVRPGGWYVVEDWNGAFENDRQPGSPYPWGEGLLETVAGFLRLLHDRDAECDEITYRYGLAILHKAKP